MSINPDHLRELIAHTLQGLATEIGRHQICSLDAIELLVLTAAQETNAGTYLKQVKGPALGIYQMEPRTYMGLVKGFIKKEDGHKLFNAYLSSLSSHMTWQANMMYNLVHQTVMARLYYWSVSAPLPDHSDVEVLAEYYKKYWNTHMGKATVEQAMSKYKRYGGKAVA